MDSRLIFYNMFDCFVIKDMCDKIIWGYEKYFFKLSGAVYFLDSLQIFMKSGKHINFFPYVEY